jgi:RNA-directed DNA polymerase
MQAKLHRWAVADPGRRFEDLFNFVHDPATLMLAFERVAGNRGANTPGVDGLSAAWVEENIGVSGFLEDLRTALKAGTFCPLPVRERAIPKPGGSGKVRKLGIPTIADWVVQAALKLGLEPIFEAGFSPVSYGFRPGRRAHDAIAEIHMFGSRGYRWVLDADIEACFDRIDHTALLERVRIRVKDKRVLALVKAFLKAGVLNEQTGLKESDTGTPQGGILSPLLANIALTVLDEHVMDPWKPDGQMGTTYRRHARRRKGLPTWRVVRYADDFVVLVHGRESDVENLREEIAGVLARLGLRLSPTKTRVVHMSEGFDFLGFHIRWRRKRGTQQWYVYTLIADRPLKAVKAKIRSMTHRVSQADPGSILVRINQILRGWANYFRHSVCSHTLNNLKHFVEWRVIRWLRKRHRLRWKELRRRFTTPRGGGCRCRGMGSSCSTRHRWRSPATGTGERSPPRGSRQTTPDGRDCGEPGASRGARRVRRAAHRNGPVATPEPRCGPTQPPRGPSCPALLCGVKGPGHEVEAFQRRGIVREMAPCPHGAPVAGVEGFDRVGRADHAADLGVPVKERGELGPGVAPEPPDRRVLRGPFGLEFPEPFTGCRLRRGGVYRLEAAGELVPVLARRVAESVADQMDHARLDGGLLPDRGDRLGQALKPVPDRDAHLLHAAVLDFGQDPRPVLRAFTADSGPDSKDVAFAVHGDTQDDVEGLIAHLPVADLDVDGVDEDHRVDAVKGPVGPFGHLLRDLRRDPADGVLRHDESLTAPGCPTVAAL